MVKVFAALFTLMPNAQCSMLNAECLKIKAQKSATFASGYCYGF